MDYLAGNVQLVIAIFEIYYFRKMVTKHYIILYSIKNKTVIIKKVLTQGMNI